MSKPDAGLTETIPAGRPRKSNRAISRRVGFTVVAVAGVMLIGLPLSVTAGGQLATEKLQKAAVKCQKIIAQVSAKVLTGKFKALDACANAALTCVQTKQGEN